MEGITDYYADLFLVRAGVATRDEYLDALSEQIRSLQTTPGRLEQSVEAASYDAWIKYYRADENTPNTAISYYVKGAVIGFLLDANIRRLTAGAKSLDDVMRADASRSFRVRRVFARGYPRVGRGRRRRRTSARDARVAGARARNDGGARLCGCAGVVRSSDDAAGAERRAPTSAWRHEPRTARPSSPAFAAGRRPLPPACRCWTRSRRSTASRCRQGSFAERLERMSPGSKVTLTITRRGDAHEAWISCSPPIRGMAGS